MRVDLTVLPYSLCKNASKYENQRSDNDTEKYIDPSHMLCVGSAKPVPWKAAKGIWQGDSGGRYFVSNHCKIYYDYNRKSIRPWLTYLHTLILGPLIIRDNQTRRYTLIGVASTSFPTLVNRTVVATYARINKVLPWIYSFMYDIDFDSDTEKENSTSSPK